MNFEEALEKLKERHEALAQSVELWVAMHHANERQFAEFVAEARERSARVDAQISQNAAQISQNGKDIGDLTKLTRNAMEAVTRLANIAGIHQELLDDHEGRLDNLEKPE